MDLLAVPSLSWLALALHRRRWLQAFIATALLVSVKEDMFIPASAAILVRALTGQREDVKRSVAIGAVAVAYSLLAMVVLLKRFGPPPGVPVYMAAPDAPTGGYKFLRNFRHLAVYGGPLRALFGQPVRFILYAFTDSRLTTLLGFVMPLAFLPFISGLRLVHLAPLGIVLLSDNPEIVALRYHYSAIQHPGVFFAAAWGALNCTRRSSSPGRAQEALAALIVTGAIVMQGMHPASVWAPTHVTDWHVRTPHSDAVDRLVAQVPPEARITTTTFLGPRVSNRPWGQFFPHGIQEAEFALVDLQRPPWPLDVRTRDEMIRAMLRGDWGAVAWEDGAVLLRRNHSRQRNDDALRDLFARRRYEVEGTEWTDFPACSERDRSASDGWARVLRPSDPRPAGFVVFGPFVRLPPGRWTVTFRLRAEPQSSRLQPIGALDVFSHGASLASLELSEEHFPDAAWRDIPLQFTVTTTEADDVEFRVRSAKRWVLGADYISIAAADEADVVRRLADR